MNEIYEEASGVFVGTLQEDMIATVERTHKLYCDVLIPQFFSKEQSYPLTYVPLWAMALPLKKGDNVMVYFHNDNYLHPVLYKNPNEIDEGFYTKFSFGNFIANGNVDRPESQETLGAFRLGKDSYVIKTEGYTIIHQNNSFILMDDDNIYTYGNKINIVGANEVNIDSESIKLYATNNCEIKVKGDCKINSTGTTNINNHLTVNGAVL